MTGIATQITVQYARIVADCAAKSELAPRMEVVCSADTLREMLRGRDAYSMMGIRDDDEVYIVANLPIRVDDTVEGWEIMNVGE